MAAVLGLIIGVVLGVFVKPDIPIILQPYLPIMVVAALDALLGAARAYFERSFSDKVFVISFISNVVTATLLVFLGNQLGVGSQLQTASSSCWESVSSRTCRQSVASSSGGDEPWWRTNRLVTCCRSCTSSMRRTRRTIAWRPARSP